MPPDARLLRRPLAVLVALFLGLGGLGTAAGAVLGAVSAGPPAGHGHHHDGDRGPRDPGARDEGFRLDDVDPVAPPGAGAVRGPTT